MLTMRPRGEILSQSEMHASGQSPVSNLRWCMQPADSTAQATFRDLSMSPAAASDALSASDASCLYCLRVSVPQGLALLLKLFISSNAPRCGAQALREVTSAHDEAARANVQAIWNACVGTLAILDSAVVHATHRHDGASNIVKDLNMSPAAASDALAASAASCL